VGPFGCAAVSEVAICEMGERNYSEHTAEEIDREARRILDEIYARVVEILLTASRSRAGHIHQADCLDSATGRDLLPDRISMEARMRFESYSFGSMRIDGVTYDHDVIVDRGHVHKRRKKPSKKFREAFGHTPLSLEEEIPWKCRRLVVGTGGGALPVMEDVKREAERRDVELLILPTAQAIDLLNKDASRKSAQETNAILHVTC
jgi:hypothetical protein